MGCCFIDRLSLLYWDLSADYIGVRLDLRMENEFDILLIFNIREISISSQRYGCSHC